LGPSAHDRREDSQPGSTLCRCIRRRPDRNILGVRQGAWIRLVEEKVRRVNVIVDISCLVGHNLEDVGVAIPPTE